MLDDRRRLICRGLFAAPLALAAGRALPAADHEQAAALAQRLLEALREASGVPGLGAAIWWQGRPAWQGGSGWRDLAHGLPVEADTRFRLASVSKLLTATAAARLHQQGRLDVDRPVQLPGFGMPGRQLTPRQLAGHLSGLPHYQAIDAGRGRRAWPDSCAALALIAQRPLLSAPGERYLYSSWGYTLLGAAVEQATDRHLLQLLRTELAPQLDIVVDGADSGDAYFSRAYTTEPGAPADGWRLAPPHDYSYCLGGAGLAACPAALAAWGGKLLAGGVVDAATQRWMLVPQRQADGSLALHDDAGVAFGWRVQEGADGEAMWHHAGATAGARSALLLLPQQGLAVSLLSNALWTAAIVGSARVLTAPFLPPPPLPARIARPRPGQRWSARLGSRTLSGQVEPGPEDQGWLLRPDRSQAPLDNGGPPRSAALRLLDLGPDAGDSTLARAALATPLGLFELRAGADGRLVSPAGRLVWSLSFEAGLVRSAGEGTAS